MLFAAYSLSQLSTLYAVHPPLFLSHQNFSPSTPLRV